MKKSSHSAVASSLQQAGFTDIVLIGDSGGNQRGLQRVAGALNARWADRRARAHFVGEYYDPGWTATERYTEDVLGVAETRSDGHHDDIWVTAMMAVTDPEQIRHRQRLARGLATINGVSIASLDDTVRLGRAMIDFRAELTARAVRSRLAGN